MSQLNLIFDMELDNNWKIETLEDYINDLDKAYYTVIANSQAPQKEKERLIKQFNLIYLQQNSILKQLKKYQQII
jgi:hypothetical protein